jgi:hypothetical protein
MRYADSYATCLPPEPGPEPTGEQYDEAERRVAESLTIDDIHDVVCDMPRVRKITDEAIMRMYREDEEIREYVLRRFDGRVEDTAHEIMQAEIERARREARAA